MIISIVNQKGGTGKTTSVINIGKALLNSGKKVLLLDLDPQGNLSYSLGYVPQECVAGEMLLDKKINETDIVTSGGQQFIPSNNDLINYEFEFIKQDYDFTLVKEACNSIKHKYDYILIDCPPSASFLTYNALIASDAVIIPMQMDVLSLQGLEQILQTINSVKNEFNSSLFILGVLGVLVDSRRQLTYDILDIVRADYGVSVFNNFIRQNVKAAEAPSHGISVIEYAPECNASKDYINVTKELLAISKN